MSDHPESFQNIETPESFKLFIQSHSCTVNTLKQSIDQQNHTIQALQMTIQNQADIIKTLKETIEQQRKQCDTHFSVIEILRDPHLLSPDDPCGFYN